MSALYHLELGMTLMLTGLIWTIQVVHYPSFNFIDPLKFRSFNEFHQRRISYVVMPLMLLELGLVSLLTALSAPGAGVRLCLTLLIWLSTFFLSVPLHQRLLLGPDPQVIRRLILTNWPRTVLWSMKCLIAFYEFKVY